MKKTYVIPEIECEAVTKILARYAKKAATYGQQLDVEYSAPYATEIAMYEYVNDENGISHRVKVGTTLVEVFDLTIESEIICKGGYTVVAKIEHLEGGNVVYKFGEVEHKTEWNKLKPRCEHCGGKHGQKVTFIVRDEAGSDKQVGRTCLKDYCGIDPQRIGWINQLHDLILGLDPKEYDFSVHTTAYAYSTLMILALAIRVVKRYGYVPSGELGSNKERLLEMARKNERPTEAEEKQAAEMMEVIKGIEHAHLHLLDNVQALLNSGYCKNSHFGYIAYAPVAYERYQQAQEKEKARQAQHAAEQVSSEYVGEIGKRITIDIEDVKLVTSWETQFGYTYLYKMIDIAGNVLVWFASREMNFCEVKKIKATIKEHSEREGVKQTVVTRCAVAAA